MQVTDRVCWGMGWISSTLNVPIPSAQVPGYPFRDLSHQRDDESHHTPFHPFTATPTPRQNNTRMTPTQSKMAQQSSSTWRGAYKVCPKFFLFYIFILIIYVLSQPHLIPSPATQHTPHPSTSRPPLAPSNTPCAEHPTPHARHKKHVLRVCFSCLAPPQQHLSCQTSKMRSCGRVFNVRLLLHSTPHARQEKHVLEDMLFVSGASPTTPLMLHCIPSSWTRKCTP